MVKEHSHLGTDRGRTRIEIKRADEADAAVSDKRLRMEARAALSQLSFLSLSAFSGGVALQGRLAIACRMEATTIVIRAGAPGAAINAETRTHAQE
jgi:hypothetical protein